MRTTIRLSDDFYRVVRARAASEGLTFTSFLEQALREHLARAAAEPEHRAFAVVPFHGSGVQPGVDLADSARLLERMEG
jgi:hypothetical protein